MKIKDLIVQLEQLYNSYSEQDKSIMGEPEIVIDIFRLAEDYPGYPKLNSCRFLREYAGFSGEIIINKSGCGVYDILSAFDEDQSKEPKAPQPASSSMPGP